MRYTVVKAHRPEASPPLVLVRGDRLRWERRPTAWEGWLFCESTTGVRGWVPEAWLRVDADEAELTRDYDATELTLSAGDVVDGELIESGWLFAKDASGRLGWVPLECLEGQA